MPAVAAGLAAVVVVVVVVVVVAVAAAAWRNVAEARNYLGTGVAAEDSLVKGTLAAETGAGQTAAEETADVEDEVVAVSMADYKASHKGSLVGKLGVVVVQVGEVD
ncbi:hypothetical protein EDD21DRAFT_370596 [Dissophora ornata]|nr:hypothetical protein EDD21DRAFT_370596 [Dissophora ornata]